MTRALALLLGLAALPAPAATCSISAQPVTFGTYDPLAPAADDAVGQVSVTCSNPVNLLLTYTVSLTAGAGSFAYREMVSGSGRLRYNLYVDPARLTVWGDGTAGTSRVTQTTLATLLGAGATHTVYGRVPAQQNVAVGSYADTITATVEY